MDAQEPIVSDFSFAFKRRSHSPSPHDCLAPATLYRAPSTSGSQSPPPSLSDATSSHGSPKDWNSLPWNPAYQIPDMNSVAHSFNWQWPQKQPDANFLPAVDPMSLTLGEAMSLASEPPFFNPSLPIDVGPQTAYSLLHSLNGLSHPLQPTQSLPQQPVVFSQPSVADFAGAPLPANVSAQDNEAIYAAIKASGIHIAAVNPTSRDILSNVPVRTPTPPPPKPDLTACPPLAKHLQPAARLTTSVSPSTTSPNSRPDSPSLPETESQLVYGASGRPKTSHTTIERRYRTNLNARILALRRAVPALRILEKDENQNLAFPEDVVDERGFVDGVRAARKASKASILGKAAEYIHVLKKREIRLRHESTGLRLLVGSLVGGQALLREFDRTWKDRYGGEEMDESVDLSDGEDDDGTDEDEDKPRKKAKSTNSKPSPQKRDKKAEELPIETGKRKRGRPKKVQTNDDQAQLLSSQSGQPVSIPPSPHNSGDLKNMFGTQYLLGAFLFFSFFQSPNDNSLHYPHESHSGSVIGSPSPKVVQHIGKLAWTEFPRLWSLTSVVALLLLVNWTVQSVRRAVWTAVPKTETEELRIKEALVKSDIGSPVQAVTSLRASLKVAGPLTEFARLFVQPNRERALFPSSAAETRAWLRLVNLELLSGTSTGFGTLLALSRNLPRTPPALVALAMEAYGFSSILAQRYWDSARSMVLGGSQYPERSIEAVALKMSVQDAHTLLVKGIRQGLMDTQAQNAALQTVVAVLVFEAFHCLAKAELLRIVDCMVAHGDDDTPTRDQEIEEAMAFVTSTGDIVGGSCRQLLKLWKEGFRSIPDRFEIPLEALTGAAADTRDLIKAVVLLRGIQESSILTPTSSTSSLHDAATRGRIYDSENPNGYNRQRSLSNRLALRQLLAAPVFESEEVLEDARDAIIDMLYEDRRY